MLDFIKNNIGSIIVAAALIVIIIPIVRKLYHDRKKGNCSSCVGCAGCSGCSMYNNSDKSSGHYNK